MGEDKKRVALFCGSFDPFHKGHKYVVDTALKLFDEVIVCVAVNPSKKGYFDLRARLNILEAIFKDNGRVKIVSTEGLIVDIAKEYGASFIVKGVRNSKDFEDEIAQSDANRYLGDGLETILIPTPNELSYISSTLIRTIIQDGKGTKQDKLRNLMC